MEDNRFNFEEEEQKAMEFIKLEEQRKESELAKQIENSYFSNRIKKIYKEVRAEEKAKKFRNRHKKFQENAINYYGTDGKYLKLKYGMVHVLGELFYHTDRLKIRRDDTTEKYLVRNRFLTLALMWCVGFGIGYNAAKAYFTIFSKNTYINENDDRIIMVRYYEVQEGDTLSELSEECGISMESIKEYNDMDGTWLYTGDVLALEYMIKPSELEYYTQRIDTEGMSIDAIADIYDTDIETILDINDNIVVTDDEYKFVGDTVLVPNFITQEELKELKKDNKSLVK